MSLFEDGVSGIRPGHEEHRESPDTSVYGVTNRVEYNGGEAASAKAVEHAPSQYGNHPWCSEVKGGLLDAGL